MKVVVHIFLFLILSCSNVERNNEIDKAKVQKKSSDKVFTYKNNLFSFSFESKYMFTEHSNVYADSIVIFQSDNLRISTEIYPKSYYGDLWNYSLTSIARESILENEGNEINYTMVGTLPHLKDSNIFVLEWLIDDYCVIFIIWRDLKNKTIYETTIDKCYLEDIEVNRIINSFKLTP